MKPASVTAPSELPEDTGEEFEIIVPDGRY